MSLKIVATPIGHPDDITLRALTSIKEADLLIGEERKITSQLLRRHDLSGKPMELLNEHSTPEEVSALADLCLDKNVVLVSDCGTPIFCDPGSALIRECRKRKIAVTSVPGASSLMTLLSLLSFPLKDFYFVGFLPAETEKRIQRLKQLKTMAMPLVLMDTPYRLHKLLEELKNFFPDHQCLFGCQLTEENELILEGPIKTIAAQIPFKKAEFILIIYKR